MEPAGHGAQSSMMAVSTKAAEGRSLAPSAAGGVDLISALCDDVLVRILELLPDVRDAARTDALSRRWRGLWTRMRALRLVAIGRNFRPAIGTRRLIAFVNKRLSQRARMVASLDHLQISLVVEPPRPRKRGQHLVPPAVEAVQAWIRHAVQQAVKSFELHLRLPLPYCNPYEMPEVILDELPSSGKLETMRLALRTRVRLPATAAFTSLADLSLENMVLPGGCGVLSRLLSSACCPRLQKLRLSSVTLPGTGTPGSKELLLDAGSLSELSWSVVNSAWTLELKTPSLRVLHMKDYWISKLTISAPRLEELMFLESRFRHIDIDGELSCVRILKVQLADYDHSPNITNAGLGVLRRCTSVRCLEVSLRFHDERKYAAADIINGIPHMPHVTFLTLHVTLWTLHSLGVVIVDILTRCSNLKFLRVHCTFYPNDGIDFLSDHLDHWKSHEINLAHLQEVEYTGLVGTDCDIKFLEFLLSSATQLRQASVSFDQKSELMGNRSNFFELTPRVGNRVWTACPDAHLTYRWKDCLRDTAVELTNLATVT
ncbi:hypothetical protein ACP70R_010299 [Stipagrostis hirtigluma subsp. patula]